MRKIAIPDKKYQYITDDNRFCDKNTAFLITKQNQKFTKNNCCCNINLDDIRSVFYIDEVKIIGITGTNGKTTTSSLIYSLLLDLGYKVALQGTRGFFINGKEVEKMSHTTPPILDTYRHIYQAVAEDCDFFVMEVSSHAIAQERIETLNFKLKVHTNITGDHLDFHQTMANYIAVKNSFFQDESQKIINIDDKNIRYNIKNSYTYSLENFATSKLLAYSIKDEVSGILSFGTETADFYSNLFGFFNLYNILASVLSVKVLTNKPLSEITTQIENFFGVEGRMEVVSFDPLIIVDFAHTPDGIKQVLTTFKTQKLITIFGAGGNRDKIKRGLMGKVAEELSHKIILTSDNPRCENPEDIIQDILTGINNIEKIEVQPDRYEAIKFGIDFILKQEDSQKYILLILGKGDEQYQYFCDKKILFDDRKVVKKILDEKLNSQKE